MVKESIKHMLDQMTSGDKEAAAQTVNDILTDKISAAIENMRVDVASQLFDGGQSQNESVEDEILDEGIMLGGKMHPSNRIPMEHYDEFRKTHKGAVVRFRGPRGKNKAGTGWVAHTKKANATHFYVVTEGIEECFEDMVVIQDVGHRLHAHTAKVLVRNPDGTVAAQVQDSTVPSDVTNVVLQPGQFKNLGEDVEISESISAEIKKHLDAGHKVRSVLTGAVGQIVDINGSHARIKHPGRQGHGSANIDHPEYNAHIVKRGNEYLVGHKTGLGAIEEERFEKGEDVGKPGLNFKKISASAAKRYGSKEAGDRVAGAILKKVLAKRGE